MASTDPLEALEAPLKPLYDLIGRFDFQDGYGYKLGYLHVEAENQQVPVEALIGERSELMLLNETMASVPWQDSMHARPYVTALIESLDSQGYLSEPVVEIANRYSGGRGRTLDLDILAYWRTFVRDHGPVLGMAAHGSGEFRACLVRHLRYGVFMRESIRQNRDLCRYMRQLQYLQRDFGISLIASLDELADRLRGGSVRRDLVAQRVKNTLGCEESIAQILAQAYNRLPKSPFQS